MVLTVIASLATVFGSAAAAHATGPTTTPGTCLNSTFDPSHSNVLTTVNIDGSFYDAGAVDVALVDGTSSSLTATDAQTSFNFKSGVFNGVSATFHPGVQVTCAQASFSTGGNKPSFITVALPVSPNQQVWVPAKYSSKYKTLINGTIYADNVRRPGGFLPNHP